MNVSGSSLNVIRVIAMAGILADHYFQASGVPVLMNTGLLLGGVFLMVFFALSAYLFGMKWAKGGYETFPVKNFLKKRCLRIYIPLWLMLPIVIVVEYFIRHAFDVKTILFNVIGLGWARPFSVAGHLWYITLMMFLYLIYLVLSRLRLDKWPISIWLVSYMILTTVYVFGGRYFSTFSSVAPVITVLLASMLFFKGDELLDYCQRCQRSVAAATLFALALSWWMYVQGWHYTHKAVATFSSFSAGFALFICLLTFIKSKKSSRIINHLADISYEVYLVHLPLLPLTAFVFEWVGLNYRWFVIMSWLIITYVAALGLHKMEIVLRQLK